MPLVRRWQRTSIGATGTAACDLGCFKLWPRDSSPNIVPDTPGPGGSAGCGPGVRAEWGEVVAPAAIAALQA
jgi:hypothetical protein